MPVNNILKTRRDFKHGFTLIELLVVMAVLGVLATIGVQTFPASQKKARDANRKSDLKQYQTALETTANKNNGLYESSAGVAISAHTTLCGYLGFSAGDCSKDPKDATANCAGGVTCAYNYITPNCGVADTACATTYVLWGALENPADISKKYFVVCSNGKSGESVAPAATACPI